LNGWIQRQPAGIGMKFSMPKESLSRTLQAVVSAVPPKSTLPILSNFLLEAKEGRLKLTSTDLDMSVCTETTSNVATDGRVTVPARRFADIVRELPQDEVKIGSDELRLTLDCSIGQFTLMGMDPEEFPKLPEVEEGTRLSLSAGDLGRAIRSTAYAVSTDETRPVLNGVLAEVRDGAIRFVATDGHRLARSTLKDSGLRGAKKADIIIPPKTLALVQKLASDETARVDLMLTRSYAIFTIGETTIYSRLLEGPFPNYEQVIPRENPKRAVVNRGQLISSLRRVSILADSITHQVRFCLRKEQIVLKVATTDVGEANETLPTDYTGADLDIGFNAAYLTEALRNMDGESVVMAFDKPTTATVVSPMEGGIDDTVALVMPLRLTD
jgi:DNA polymerase III subunit beta